MIRTNLHTGTYGLAFRIICPKHPPDRPHSYPNRPNVRDPVDPLEIPDIYGQARLRLNYRMSYAELPTFIPWILSWTVGSILAVLALRAAGLWLTSDFLWSLLALVAVIQACHVMISDQQTGLAIAATASVFWIAVLVLKHFSAGAAGVLFASLKCSFVGRAFPMLQANRSRSCSYAKVL